MSATARNTAAQIIHQAYLLDTRLKDGHATMISFDKSTFGRDIQTLNDEYQQLSAKLQDTAWRAGPLARGETDSERCRKWSLDFDRPQIRCEAVGIMAGFDQSSEMRGCAIDPC